MPPRAIHSLEEETGHKHLQGMLSWSRVLTTFRCPCFV